jgi:hypothetical protein
MTESVLAAAQPENFTADFTIKITGLRTATINGIENAVRQVDWVLSGSESGQVFELPQTTQVPDPQADGFIPLASLTEAEVVMWIETHDTRLPGFKAHVQYVLDGKVAQAALQPTAMPWAPATEAPVTPPQAPAA